MLSTRAIGLLFLCFLQQPVLSEATDTTPAVKNLDGPKTNTIKEESTPIDAKAYLEEYLEGVRRKVLNENRALMDGEDIDGEQGDGEEEESNSLAEVPLLPFQISFKENGQEGIESADVQLELEAFLYAKLWTGLPTLVGLRLDYDESEQQDESIPTTYFSGGAGMFLDPTNEIPTKEQLHIAQETILDDTYGLQRFVNENGRLWVLESVVIGENNDEDDKAETVSDSGVANVVKSDEEKEEPKEGGNIMAIIFLSVGVCLLVFAILLVRRHRLKRQRGKDEELAVSSLILRKRRLERKASSPSSKSVDMCGNIDQRNSGNRIPRGRSQISSQGMEIDPDGEMMEAGAWK